MFNTFNEQWAMTKPEVNLEVRNPVVAGGWKQKISCTPEGTSTKAWPGLHQNRRREHTNEQSAEFQESTGISVPKPWGYQRFVTLMQAPEPAAHKAYTKASPAPQPQGKLSCHEAACTVRSRKARWRHAKHAFPQVPVTFQYGFPQVPVTF